MTRCCGKNTIIICPLRASQLLLHLATTVCLENSQRYWIDNHHFFGAVLQCTFNE